MCLYFDVKTIGMEREEINASTHLYGSVSLLLLFFDPFLESDII